MGLSYGFGKPQSEGNSHERNEDTATRRERTSGVGTRQSWQTLASALCPSARSVQAFLTGKIDENTKFDPTDFRNNVPRFLPEARKPTSP